MVGFKFEASHEIINKRKIYKIIIIIISKRKIKSEIVVCHDDGGEQGVLHC
jgi:hypothetical protein